MRSKLYVSQWTSIEDSITERRTPSIEEEIDQKLVPCKTALTGVKKIHWALPSPQRRICSRQKLLKEFWNLILVLILYSFTAETNTLTTTVTRALASKAKSSFICQKSNPNQRKTDSFWNLRHKKNLAFVIKKYQIIWNKYCLRDALSLITSNKTCIFPNV